MQRSLVRSTRDAVTNQAATAYVTTSTSTAAINCALTCVVTTSTPTAAINCAAEPVCVLQKLVDLTVRNKRLAADNRTLQQGGTVTAAPARTLGKSKWGKVRASVVTESAGDSSCSTGLCCCFLHYCAPSPRLCRVQFKSRKAFLWHKASCVSLCSPLVMTYTYSPLCVLHGCSA